MWAARLAFAQCVTHLWNERRQEAARPPPPHVCLKKRFLEQFFCSSSSVNLFSLCRQRRRHACIFLVQDAKEGDHCKETIWLKTEQSGGTLTKCCPFHKLAKYVLSWLIWPNLGTHFNVHPCRTTRALSLVACNYCIMRLRSYFNKVPNLGIV